MREDPGMAFGVWQSWLCDLWEIHLPFKPQFPLLENEGQKINVLRQDYNQYS